MIRVLFFGRLREQLDVAELELTAVQSGDTVATLRAHLVSQGGRWPEALAMDNLLCAVNQVQSSNDAALNDGDEVAFFPPVTGG